MNNKLSRLLAIFAVGLLIWLFPHPEGVTVQAWHLMAIMVATIVGFIVSPLPIGATAFLGMLMLILTQTLSLAEALAGFSNSLLWLIVMAFMFSRAFIKTNLGRRISLKILSKIGDSTLKISYALALSGTILSPVIPSGTARAAGIIFPILRGMCSSLDSEPDHNPGRVGKFLVQSYFQAECFIGYLFVTSMAGNVLVATFAKDLAGMDLTWGMWSLATLVPGLIGFITVPYAVYLLCPPDLKKVPEAKAIAQKELDAMGPTTRKEIYLCVIFVTSVLLWATGDLTGLGSTTVAFLAVAFMLLLDILDWKDVLAEDGGWDTFIWMGVLVTMAGQLTTKGFIGWLGTNMGGMFAGMNWIVAMALICLFFNYTQYAFASSTAHLVGLLGACLTAALSVHTPPMLAILLLALIANVPGALTQYSCGMAPIFFNAGYFDIKEWWRIGFIMSWLHLLTLCIFGPPWWKLVGLW